MSRVHCRCRTCRARVVLRRPPDQYRKAPQCRVCGKRDYHADRWMNRRDTRGMACTCAGYWFIHRRGSLFCWYRPDGSGRYPGDADFYHRDMELTT